MAGAARQGDSVLGITVGEHAGHAHPHSPMQFTGTVSGGCSSNVYVNGRPAAMVGSSTIERDGCCGAGTGNIVGGSSSVFINGSPAARDGDALRAHSGKGIVNSGSDNVIIGG